MLASRRSDWVRRHAERIELRGDAPPRRRVEVELYRLGEREPYRSAHVWTYPGQ